MKPRASPSVVTATVKAPVISVPRAVCRRSERPATPLRVPVTSERVRAGAPAGDRQHVPAAPLGRLRAGVAGGDRAPALARSRRARPDDRDAPAGRDAARRPVGLPRAALVLARPR